MVCNFLGMALGALLPASSGTLPTGATSSPSASLPHTKLVAMSILDLGGNILGLFGLALAGSGVRHCAVWSFFSEAHESRVDDLKMSLQTYQVIYSSIILFNALFSRILLNKVLSQTKIFALVVIFFGLSISALGTSSSSTSSSSSSSSTYDSSSTKLVGIGFTLLCTAMYGLHYVVSESVVGTPHPPSLTLIQGITGGYALTVLTIYSLFHTVPNFNILVIDNVKHANGNVYVVVTVYFLLVFSAFLHSVTYFRLISSMGSVSTGVLQSLRAVTVFGLSAILFCDEYHHENCFNMMKLASTLVVVCGILIYSSASTLIPVSKKEPVLLAHAAEM